MDLSALILIMRSLQNFYKIFSKLHAFSVHLTIHTFFRSKYRTEFHGIWNWESSLPLSIELNFDSYENNVLLTLHEAQVKLCNLHCIKARSIFSCFFGFAYGGVI